MPDPIDNKLKILVVDDSKVILKAFSKIIGDGYQIISASDGYQAWEILQQDHTICTVFTDMLMPELDGLGLLKLIRGSESSIIKNLPVILVTSAEDEDQQVQEAFTLGITDLVRKPFDRLLLQACAKAHVKARHIQTDSESAGIDPITKLATKSYFNDRGEQDVAAAVRHKNSLCIALLQLDNYAEIKQQYAPQESIILTKIGAFIRGMLRKEDTLAHFGSGEYGLITSENNIQENHKLYERIKSNLADKSFTIDGDTLNVSVCIGFSCIHMGEENSFGSLVNVANKNLAEARNAGANSMQGQHKKTNAVVENTFNSINDVLDKILVMLHRNQEHLTRDLSAKIILKMLSLMKFCNNKCNLGIENELESLKQKIKQND